MSADLDIASELVLHTAAEAPAKVEPVLLDIVPESGWKPLDVRELWKFRELIYFLTWRDVKVRYKQTLLGAAWAVLQPAMWMVVFTIFFNRMARVPAGDVPYPVFTYLGLLPWTFFATAISNAGNSVVGSERLVTKIFFPRLAIPFAAVAAAVVDFVIALGLLVGLMAWFHVGIGPAVFVAPLVFAVILLMALGIGTLLAALNVTYRDFRYVIPFMVQIWMLATPTIYMEPARAANDRVHAILNLNPMTALVGTFRAACTGGAIDWERLGISAAFAVCVFLIGCLYFRRTERNFADVI